MITVTGATGQLGAAAIDFLLEKGLQASMINALSRSAEKAQALADKGVNISIGSYDDYNSLVKAFKGTQKLLFVSGSELGKREPQHLNVVNAAKEAGVEHIVYTSFQRQSEAPDSPLGFVIADHLATEKAIKGSGMTYTILRNNLYMDMMPMILGEKVLETGVFYPAEEGHVAFTLRSDMAEGAANVLLTEGHVNKEYNFSNTQSFTFSEVADFLSAVSGNQVNYISPSAEAYHGALAAAGVPEMYIGMMSMFANAIAKGELIAGDTDLPAILGRTPTSFQDFLTQVFAQAGQTV